MAIEREPMEDFPLETFKFLEEKLQILRRKIIKKATEIAKKECPKTAQIYRVTDEHVKQAIKEIVGIALWSHI